MSTTDDSDAPAGQAPRITFAMSEARGLDIYMNEAGRDLLIRELLLMRDSWDHQHFGPYDDSDIQVRRVAYLPDQEVIEWGTIHLRRDAWDEQHFPHVMIEPPDEEAE